MSLMPDEREIRKEAYAEGRNIGLGIGGVAGLAFGYYWGQRSFLFAAALFIGGALLFAIIGGCIWWFYQWHHKATDRQMEVALRWWKWLFLVPFMALMAWTFWFTFLRH